MNHSGEAKMIVALRSILPAVMLACIGAGQTAAQPVCKPALTVKQVGFSEMINLRRVWTASIDVDASRCTTTSGLYSIGFIRLYENAPDRAFTEPFIWRQGQRRVVVEFWAGEAVQSYWIDDIAACPCRGE
jgi:hypothetical protein